MGKSISERGLSVVVPVLVSIGAVLLAAAWWALRQPIATRSTSDAATVSRGAASYASQWRGVWLEHVATGRTATNGVIDQAPGTDVAMRRSRRSASDMASLIEPYFGEARALWFGRLMKEHVDTEIELVAALRARKAPQAEDAEKRWYANAYAVSALLEKMSPSIDQTKTNEMLKKHLALSKQAMVDRLGKDYQAETADADRIDREATRLADEISAAIGRQFPDRFR